METPGHARADLVQAHHRLLQAERSASGLRPVEGYTKIHHDETRHIGYGVWFLRETIRKHPDEAGTVRAMLRDLLPHGADLLKLLGDGDASSLLGVSEEDLRQFALGGLARHRGIIDVPLETVFA